MVRLTLIRSCRTQKAAISAISASVMGDAVLR